MDHPHRRSGGGEPLPRYPTQTRRRDVILSRLRLNRAPYLRATQHKWDDNISPTCQHCGEADEDTEHFLMHCPRWAALRAEVFGPNATLATILHEHPGSALEFVRRTGICPSYA